jgi:hypothetical protein
VYCGYLDPLGNIPGDNTGEYRFAREIFVQTEYNSNNPIINDLGLIRVSFGIID